MSWYGERVLPRLIDLALGAPFDSARARVTEGLRGRVLEVGFGSGRNIVHLPQQVTELLVIEPSDAARRLARKRLMASPVPISVAGLDGQEISLPAASIDCALVTWTLCSIPAVDRALSEIRRVLRPGGQLHFVEHGLSPRPSTARAQHALTPLWSRLAGGCHLNRPVDHLITAGGLEISRLVTRQMPWSGPLGVMYEGIAIKTSG